MVSTTQVETQLQDIADRIDEIVTILKEMRGATKRSKNVWKRPETGAASDLSR
jgi:Glu-tRNA(Gln) amidotransferase subunit E-like FAD-binding protein